MAKHSIRFELPQVVAVANKDVEFHVYAKNRTRKPYKLIGTLKVSKGSLDWRPGKAPYSRVLGWELFADLAEEHGKKRIKL